MNSTSELERHSAASSTHRSWDFLRHGAGILPASNMADPLRGSNLGPADLLVREAVQNSLDERRADGDGPVRIRFERRVLTGSDKHRLVDALELSVLADRRRYFRGAHNWYGNGDAVLAAIAKPDAPLPVLAVYAGQAYYGIDSHEPANPRRPLEGRDAHAWARSLGLPKRSESDPGTTVMVPAAAATMHEIIESCARWWWPRMQSRDPDRRVEFEFVDEGEVLAGGRPRSRIRLFRAAGA